MYFLKMIVSYHWRKNERKAICKLDKEKRNVRGRNKKEKKEKNKIQYLRTFF